MPTSKRTQTVSDLAQDLVKQLTIKALYITTVESCTGGALVDAITNIPGSSAVIRDSFITYSNEAKVALGVPQETIEQYTVYSPEVALAMARTGLARSVCANIGVGITGSLTRVDPVNQNSIPGQVYFGIAMGTTELTCTLTIPEPTRPEAKLHIVECVLQAISEIVTKHIPKVTTRPTEIC